MRPTIFISYSHKDKQWIQQFMGSLKVGLYGDAYEIWPSEDIGRDWREQIDEKIATAKVVLLLVTPDFIKSEFVVKRILDRHKRSDLDVFLIPVKAVTEHELKLVGLHNFQFAWPLDKPLSDLASATRQR